MGSPAHRMDARSVRKRLLWFTERSDMRIDKDLHVGGDQIQAEDESCDSRPGLAIRTVPYSHVDS
ncbi:MAG: hypothetical protein HXY20_01470 [Acidobacteria bacterium]|nr:hypothetical protein [Acidobacteriota bacterium]